MEKKLKTKAQLIEELVALRRRAAEQAEQACEAAVLEERRRLARDIHDTVTQGLTGIIMLVEAAAELLTKNPEAAHLHLAQARRVAQENLAEARRVVRAWHPALAAADFPTALAQLSSHFTTKSTPRVDVAIQGTPHTLPSEVTHNLLRISQEALHNACKYAHAHSIDLVLTFEGQQVRLCVQDDGQGFVSSRPSGSGGFGLTSMRERAEQIGGKFTLTTRPGLGTAVEVVVPRVPVVLPKESLGTDRAA